MADTNKRITFTGVDDGVDAMMQKLRQSAESTTKDLIRQAREYSTSGKQVVQYIEEEIKAIEKRNRLYQQGRTLQMQQNRASELGRAESPEAKTAIRQRYAEAGAAQKVEIQQDQMQIDLMRELIDTIRQTAKDEIREDQKGVEKEIESDKRLTQLGIDADEDEADALKRTMQREAIGDKSVDEVEEQRRFDGRGALGAANTAMRVGTDANEIFMIGSVLAMIPFVGQGLSDLFTKFTQKGEEVEVASGQLYAQIGRQMGPTGGLQGKSGAFEEFGERYGYNMAEVYRQGAAATGVMGGRASVEQQNQAIMTAVQAQRGLGIDAGTVGSLAAINARQGNNIVAGQSIQALMTAQQAAGVAVGGNFSDAPEWAQMLVQIGQDQLLRLGESNQIDTIRMLSGLAQGADIFKNPASLQSSIQAIDQGMRQPNSSAAQAMQYAVLRQQNPGASRWELRKMQEEGINDPDQLDGILKRLQASSGNNSDIMMENVAAMFPNLSLRQVEGLVQGFQDDGTVMMGTQTLMDEFGQTQNIGARAKEATGTLAARTAYMDNFFMNKGQTMNEYFSNKFDEAGDVVDEFSKGLLQGSAALSKFMGNLHLMDKINVNQP